MTHQCPLVVRRTLVVLAVFLTSALSLLAADTTAPKVLLVDPPPGELENLSQITVTFDEPVTGVQASQLLLGGQAALQVTGTGDKYVFTFATTLLGDIDLKWDTDTIITDLASPANSFDPVIPSLHYILKDHTAPTITFVSPRAGAVTRKLSEVQLRFSEAVTGVDPADLLVNGIAATNLTVSGSGLYTFQFPAAADGTARISWAASSGINDLADPANSFGLTPEWTVTVNSQFQPPAIRINEFLASNIATTGLKDENGDYEDWIELYNDSDAAINLEGWSLTDDPREPHRWAFPGVSIPAKGYLVVFASAKDRTAVTGANRYHTNFKLNPFGEYLGLYDTETPAYPVSEFAPEYPTQRNDFSYGFDTSGQPRYFAKPTPGLPNGVSDITGIAVTPTLSAERGWYEPPLDLVITNREAGAEIRYTTDGSLPTATTGKVYSEKLTLTNSTVLRVAAFKGGLLPSAVLTHTYLFPDAVIHQPKAPPGFPTGNTIMGGYPADYEMDPEIVDAALYKDRMKPAMLSLPVISIAIKPDDMFGTSGIYRNPLNRGPAWERPCSMEFFAVPGGGKTLQIDSGIQIQGNAAREPIKQPKHPMRVLFKGDYGPSKLDFKMFPDSGVTHFDSLILRADFNNSWLHWDGAQRTRGQRTRDSWNKDTMRAMGNIASHNRYAHLFINGLYWGVYDPSERPDADFAASYLGGDKNGYDVINEGAAVDGTITSYNAMRAITTLTDTNNYVKMKQYLDMTQFIDYMLLHFYIGHQDWGENKNWYTFRPKDGSRGYYYVPWDGENILQANADNRVSSTDTPSLLHTKLVASTEYRLDFADRVQKHLFNGGALTPAPSISRWMNRAGQVDLAIVAETARWGDYRRDAHQYQTAPYQLYTRDNQWLVEQKRLTNDYFPKRTDLLLAQLKTAKLYPTNIAPSLNNYGGTVTNGFQLNLSAADGAIYYTLNGEDPRIPFTGAIGPSALQYSSAITLTNSSRLKSRTFKNNTWSALVEADYHVDEPSINVRITEINYHPEAGDAHEFVEIMNTSLVPVDLSGWSFDGLDFVFPHGTILAGKALLVVASDLNQGLFAAAYPGVKTAGYFSGSLANDGEKIELRDRTTRTVDSVDYNDKAPWPVGADGKGYSLELVNLAGDPNDPANWQASAEAGGNPGVFHASRVTVAPKLSATVAGSTITLKFDTAPNQSYSLERKTDLSEKTWQATTAFPASQVGGAKTVDVQINGQGKSYYRLTTDR